MVYKDMREIMEDELRKLRNYPRYHFHSFAYINEIDIVRERLKNSGVRYRTKPKYKDGVQIGYNIYVEG